MQRTSCLPWYRHNPKAGSPPSPSLRQTRPSGQRHGGPTTSHTKHAKHQQRDPITERFNQDFKTIFARTICGSEHHPAILAARHMAGERLTETIKREFGSHLNVDDVSLWRFDRRLVRAPLEFSVTPSLPGGTIIHSAQLREALKKSDDLTLSGLHQLDPRRESFYGRVKLDLPHPSPPPVRPTLPFSLYVSPQSEERLIQFLDLQFPKLHQAGELLSLVQLWAHNAQLSHFSGHRLALMLFHFQQVAQNPSSADIYKRFIHFLAFYSQRVEDVFLGLDKAKQSYLGSEPLRDRFSDIIKCDHVRDWGMFGSRARQTISAVKCGCPPGAVLGSAGSRLSTALPPNPLSPLHRNLEVEIVWWYQTNRPSPRVGMQRSSTIKRLESAIQKRFGRQYSLQVFGSTTYGIDSDSSDLDLSIVDPARPLGLAPGARSLDAIYDVRLLSNTLKDAGFENVTAIPRASVPIVKFTDPTTNLTGDVSVNGGTGYPGATLISRYCEMLPLLRPLLAFVKFWAKNLELNNPSGAPGHPNSFSSYALTLMTIGMFQSKGYLPNLQANCVGAPSGARQEMFWWADRKGNKFKCDLRFDQMNDWAPSKTLAVDKALLMWFSYWVEEFDYRNTIMDIRSGGVTPRQREPVSSVQCQFERRLMMGSYQGDATDSGDDVFADHTSSSLETSCTNLKTPNSGARYVSRASQPERWAEDGLVVPDPFYTIRNTTQIPSTSLSKFVDECTHASLMLRSWCTLQDLVPPGPLEKQTGQPSSSFDGPRSKSARAIRKIP